MPEIASWVTGAVVAIRPYEMDVVSVAEGFHLVEPDLEREVQVAVVDCRMDDFRL